MDSKKASLFIVLVALVLTTFSVLTPLTQHSYNCDIGCSRADVYLGPFMIGSVEVRVREVQSPPNISLSRINNSPIRLLQKPLPMAGIRCLVIKTIEEPMPGAPEDTVGVGLIVRTPQGSRSTLLCTAAQSEYASRRISGDLGEIYECTSTRIWETISPLKSGNVSALFVMEDFFPALSMMVRDKGTSFLQVDVVGVYTLSDTLVFNEAGRYIEVKYYGMLDLINRYPPHITVNGTDIPLSCGIAKVGEIEGLHIVEIPGVYLPIIGLKEIQLPIEL
ncbi:MAG: hypothetical protein H5T34_06290 [Candidatus Methanomethyliales bacterium]|nr:hypothetical protein [Candidatus Methanomethylicales archaeon]